MFRNYSGSGSNCSTGSKINFLRRGHRIAPLFLTIGMLSRRVRLEKKPPGCPVREWEHSHEARSILSPVKAFSIISSSFFLSVLRSTKSQLFVEKVSVIARHCFAAQIDLCCDPSDGYPEVPDLVKLDHFFYLKFLLFMLFRQIS